MICWRRDRLPTPVFLGFPCGSAERICLQCWRAGFNPWVGKIPWRRERLPTPVFWPEEFHGVAKSRAWLSDFHFHFKFNRASLMAQVVKNLSAMQEKQETWVPSLGRGRSAGEGNGNPLQYPCWKVPWTEEPSRLQSMRSKRVGHD